MIWRLAFAAVLAAAPAPAGEGLTGTWQTGEPERAGGRLLVLQEGTRLRFQLEVWRGAPSYNSGRVDGWVAHATGLRTLQISAESGCRIVAAFDGDHAIITQHGNSAACGFGHAVYADGNYKRVSRAKPVFTSPEGDVVR